MDKGKVSKESYEDLLDSEKRIKRILEATQDGFCVIGENLKFIDVNSAFCKMSGYTKEEILNIKVSDIDFYESSEDVKKKSNIIKEYGHNFFETKHIRKNGEVLDVEVSVSCLNKEPLEYFCFLRDITDKKKDKKKIIEMKERLENLANQAPGTLYQYQLFLDGTSKFPYASDGIYEIYEVRPKEIMDDASKVFERIHPDDYEKIVNSIQNSADNLEIWDEKYRVILPEKGKKWVHGNAKPEKLEDGSVLWHGNIREITRDKKLQLKVEEQKERLENIIEGTNVGTWERNVEEDTHIVNEKWAELLGYTLDELSPADMKTFERLTHLDDFDKTEKEFKKLRNQEIEYYDVEFRMKHKNGKWIWINSRAKVTKISKNSETILISGTHTDITEKKEKEKEIEYLSFHDSLTKIYNRRC